MVFFYMCSKFSFQCQNLNSNIKCYLETYELSFNINWIEIGFIIFEILAYYISFGVLEIFLHIWIEQNGLIQIWQSEKKISLIIQNLKGNTRNLHQRFHQIQTISIITQFKICNLCENLDGFAHIWTVA